MKFTFDPLHNDDGSPCYFRASCLAIFAVCLILHVFLKSPSSSNDGNISIEQGMVVNQTSNALASNNQQIVSNADGQVVTSLTETGHSKWSLFSSDEDKELASLLKNRKAAIAELADGVAFLSACGDINSGYIGCDFDFSSKVSENYVSKVEAVDDGFTITLEAKGTQKRDGCMRFEVNSEGIYQAYDVSGHLNERCLFNSALSNKVLTINRGVSSTLNNKKAENVLADSNK